MSKVYRPLIVDPKKYPHTSLCDNCKHFGKFYMQIGSGKYSYQNCGRCKLKGGPEGSHILAADDICKRHEWSEESLKALQELKSKGLA